MSDEAENADRVARDVADFMIARDRFARSLGIRLLALRPGYAQAEMDLGANMVNGLDLPHGAAIFALADFAFAAASNSHGRAAVALSMDIHFVASPSPGASLEAEAVEIRRGDRTGLYHISVRERASGVIADLHGMAYRKQERFLERLGNGS
ncbi:MAG TPA: hotdog fold thioesterase [Anaerolineales bacterium]|nr:hotdog fold thioesterase [Anaerolineales bacterium]